MGKKSREKRERRAAPGWAFAIVEEPERSQEDMAALLQRDRLERPGLAPVSWWSVPWLAPYMRIRPDGRVDIEGDGEVGER